MIGRLHARNSSKFARIIKRNKTISQINVTPMVDVMLVLLVIFMITAPLLTVGVPINLPKTKAQALPEDQAPLAITINKDEKVERFLLLHGKPGIGKTTLAHIIFNEYNYDIVEINASEQRSKKKIHERIGVIGKYSILFDDID